MLDRDNHQRQQHFKTSPALSLVRSFLRFLTYSATPPALTEFESRQLARWLIAEGLGPLTYAMGHASLRAFGARLLGDYYSAVAEDALHLERLRVVGAAFEQAGVRAALLKGAALALTIYDSSCHRPMADIDIWVRAEQIEAAVRVCHELGFGLGANVARPLALQELAQGEIQLHSLDGGLIELHWSPYPGWWVQHTACPDDEAIWGRLQPLIPTATHSEASVYSAFWQMSPEDTVIHLALHLAVNHQFGSNAIRGLVDIARVATRCSVDWEVVVQRARAWRMASATWVALDMLHELIGANGLDSARAQLRPSALRRFLLRRLVNPYNLIAQRNLQRSRLRYLLLLLLVDRPADRLRLFTRTLWPTDEWMEARYQGRANRWRHLSNVVRRGKV